MGTIAEILRSGMEGLMWPFDLLGPFWGLTLLSIVSGVGMLWVVGKTTPQKLVERARNRMDSAVYEIRLFMDSPKRVVVALSRLIFNSVLYILAMMPAFLILALPLGLMFLSLEARHGLEPIAPGQPFVVSVQLAEGVDGSKLEVTPGAGVEITSAPLYVESKRAVYFRAVAMSKKNSSVSVGFGGSMQAKSIVTDAETLQMAPERASGLRLFTSFGPEKGLDGAIVEISVPHEIRHDEYLGISMPWWLWWLLIMMVAAFALRKPMGVTL